MASLKSQIQSAKPALAQLSFAGVDCYIRRWSEKDRIEWAIFCQTNKAEGSAEDDAGDKLIRARAIAWSLCDEHGTLVFGREGVDEVAALYVDLGPAFDAVIAFQKNEKADAEAKKN